MSYFENLIHQASKNSIDRTSLKTSATEELEKALKTDDNEFGTENLASKEEPIVTFEHLEAAENMATGTWFRYSIKNTGEEVRCKLSSKLNDSDSYVFVERTGFKVFEKTRKRFALDLQENRALVLDSKPIFDRAISTINQNLKMKSHS